MRGPTLRGQPLAARRFEGKLTRRDHATVVGCPVKPSIDDPIIAEHRLTRKGWLSIWR